MSAGGLPQTRQTTRRIMVCVGVGFGLLLLTLAMTSWRIAGERVEGTEGLVGQADLLVAVFQGAVGLAVAIATIYYAGLTREMVEGMAQSAQQDRVRRVEATVDELIGSTLELALHSGAVASLLKPSWRWYLPAPARMRDRLLVQSQAQVASALTAVTRSADILRATQPSHREVIDEVLEASDAVFLRSLDGDRARVEVGALALRESADRLRAALGVGGTFP